MRGRITPLKAHRRTALGSLGSIKFSASRAAANPCAMAGSPRTASSKSPRTASLALLCSVAWTNPNVPIPIGLNRRPVRKRCAGSSDPRVAVVHCFRAQRAWALRCLAFPSRKRRAAAISKERSKSGCSMPSSCALRAKLTPWSINTAVDLPGCSKASVSWLRSMTSCMRSSARARPGAR